MLCPNCGTEAPAGAELCPNCGTDLPAADPSAAGTCPDCGARLEADALACGLCGKVLRRENAPAPPVQNFTPLESMGNAPAAHAPPSTPAAQGSMAGKVLLGIFVVWVLAVLAAWGIWGSGSAGAGGRLETFTRPDLDGTPVTIDPTEGESVKALVFFTEWCPYCKPAIAEAAALAKNVSFEPILVAIAEDAGAIRPILQKLRIPPETTVLLDADGTLFKSLGGNGVPHTVIVKDGNIVKTWAGFGPGFLRRALQAVAPDSSASDMP